MSTQREMENTERAKSMERRHEEKKRNEEYKQPSQRGSTDSREKKKKLTQKTQRRMIKQATTFSKTRTSTKKIACHKNFLEEAK